jgi:RHS repeat-associated protein
VNGGNISRRLRPPVNSFLNASFKFWLLIYLFFLITCIGAKSQANWNQAWNGYWVQPGAPGGEFSINISTNGDTISGTGANTGIGCTVDIYFTDYDSATGTVSGTVEGDSINFTYQATITTGSCAGQTLSVQFSGILSSSNQISGTSSWSTSTGGNVGSGWPIILTGAGDTNKSNGSTCSCSAPTIGEPIRIGNGNVFEKITDYTTAGLNPLSFTRFYNSLADSSSVAVDLGGNWRSSYDRYLRIMPSMIIAERADGQELNFISNGGVWTSDSDVDVRLLQSGSSWTLIDSDDTVETYSGSSGTAFLTSIAARDGYTQMLSYNTSSQLVTVTDSFNRKLQFTYFSNLVQTVTAPNGLVLTYGYNYSGIPPAPFVGYELYVVQYSTAPLTASYYSYGAKNQPSALSSIYDEDGNIFATWTYDANGRAISSQLGNGANMSTIFYNDKNGSRIVTNALGLAESYQFTMLQGVPKLTEVDRLATATVPAATTAYSYDTNGYIASISDWNTNLTMIVNDIHDQPLISSEAIGTPAERTATISYLTNFHLPLQIVAPRKTTSFTYDNFGNMLTRTEIDTSTQTVPYSTSGQTRSWTNTFDTLGHLLTSIGPRTDVLATNRFTYDDSNDLSTITDPLGHMTRLTNYNGSGLPLTMIDPNGVITSFTYDIRDRLLSRTVHAASGNATTTFGYDAAEQLTSVTLPDGALLEYQYDTAHRLQSVSNSLGESITFTLDGAGNVIQQNTANASGTLVKTQSAVFDGLSRMLQEIGADSQTNTYTYDGNGNQVSLSDGLENSTAQGFDALNRLVSVIDPLTNATVFDHDEQDNLTSVTDPRSLVTTYVYNGLGQVIQESSPDKGTTVYMPDKAGNRTNEVDARGVVTTRTFDKLNRVTAENFPASPGENITFSYDATNSGNFGVGRLTGYSDETGSTTLSYNERGDVIGTTRTIGGHAYTTSYGYDLADNITNIIYPSGHVVSYSLDSQGRINSVTYRPSSSGTSTLLANNVTYLPFGPLASLLYGNGLVRTNQLDQDYRLTNILTSAGTTNIQNLSFVYNEANNIVAMADNLASSRSQVFDYDQDYRLTRAIGLYGVDEYTYDADNNRLTGSEGGVVQTYNYSSTANQLLSIAKGGETRSFSYTLNGNIASDNRGTTTNLLFGYNNRNRYDSLTDGTVSTATYKYNALGERLIKTVGTAITDYHYDEKGHLIAESQSNGEVIREYVWLGDMPIAQIESSGIIYFIHPDQLNRPQKITSLARAIVWDNEQQPFGEAVPPTLTPADSTINKEFQVSINASPNSGFVLQGSTNLAKPIWVSLATNSAPFNFADIGVSSNHMRFYRILAATNANISSVTNNLRFPGQYFDAEASLNYNIIRDYDPTLGQYIEGDPIGLNGGINLHRFVGDNPINEIDTDGLAVYVYYHPVGQISGDPFYHTAIVLRPDNPSDFADNPLFADTGGQQATLGAQPGGFGTSLISPFGSLSGQNNFPGDNPSVGSCNSNNKLIPVQTPTGMTDAQFINALINSAGTYGDYEPYNPTPMVGPGYNSNSYVSGVIDSTGAIAPNLPVWAPGYSEPLPLR